MKPEEKAAEKWCKENTRHDDYNADFAEKQGIRTFLAGVEWSDKRIVAYCKKRCYCGDRWDGMGTLISLTKDGKRMCPYCWVLQELVAQK